MIFIKVDITSQNEIDFDKEVKKEAEKIAAYGIIKEMFTKGLISERELIYIRNKHNITIE